jgi:group I intron endonuclease|nr:MAG TPA: intron associated endonuclease [Caudoviricetes sp.]
MYTVYKHTTPSGKRYIGITSQEPERRWQNGAGYKDNEHFYRAIQKYGWENISHEIVADGLSKAQACALEIRLIAEYDTTNQDKGYNHSTGGESGRLGVHPSVETRRKISEALKGQSPWIKGKHMSAGARMNLSKAHKGNRLSIETRRKISEANKGRHFSVETRQKISKANKGKHMSAEARRKNSEAKKGANNPWYGKHLSVETRRKISEAQSKSVVCAETGKQYASTREAAKAIGLRSNGSICSACRDGRKTAGGYHWEYAG